MGREHDDAHYVLAAHSILRGEYRLGISPGNPPLTFITPGWPLLLTPAALLFGERWDLYPYYAWLWLVVCDLLLLGWLMKRLESKRAILGFLLFALNPLVLARAGHVMSEIPALALTIGLFIALERRLSGWAAGLWVSFLWLVRQPSIILAPVAAWRVWKKEKREIEACAGLLLSFAAMAGWMLWLDSVGSRLTEIDELGATSKSLSDLIGAAAGNAAYYARLWGATMLPLQWSDSGASSALGLPLLAAAGFGAYRLLRKDVSDPAMGWLAGAALLHLAWPWHYERYLVSLLPMLIVAVIAAADSIKRMKQRAAAFSVLAALGAASFSTQGSALAVSARERGQVELSSAYDWIRANVPPEQALAGIYYSREALYTGRPFSPLPSANSAAEFADLLKRSRIDWVLLPRGTDFGSTLGARFAGSREVGRIEVYLKSPSFQLAFSDPARAAFLYKRR